MRTALIAVATAWALSPFAFVAWFVWPIKSPGRSVRGEAHRPTGESPAGSLGVDGGHEPRGGGDLPASRQGMQVSDNSRPSVPAREQIDGYRPARENRYWVNDFALAGALDQWSKELSS